MQQGPRVELHRLGSETWRVETAPRGDRQTRAARGFEFQRDRGRFPEPVCGPGLRNGARDRLRVPTGRRGAMNGWGNETMPRADDRRRLKGQRVIFRAEDQPDAYLLARLLAKRLSPARAHQLRLLAEEMLRED